MTAKVATRGESPRSALAALALAACAWPVSGAPDNARAAALAREQATIAAWRSERLESLTSDNGWLTLAGLFWLKEGENTFGRAPANALVLDHGALAEAAGSFVLSAQQVRFLARPDSHITHDGQPVTAIDLAPDTSGHPTVLSCGTLRFFVIERAGNLGVRVRDLANPHRTGFRGLEYFPVSSDWVVNARFERYQPAHHLRIVNVLGMELDMESPGAVVFVKDGREWRLDTLLEEPGDQELSIMFADATSGHETYGAGRFLDIPIPEGATVPVDFNKAYNPPCALNEFATCPLPPAQNRLALRVTAGEKKYAGGPEHHL
ncbi:MAG TPA: DUF1684 domain-containing protein [Steroidobacteraceae bacterium]|nr:DUF1684 domain-containing protein [Steroidobacteraceae bacterium]